MDEYDKNIEGLWKGVENHARLEYTFHRAEQSRAEQSRAEQSRAEQRLTAPFLRLAAAGRLKLNTTFVMDNRWT